MFGIDFNEERDKGLLKIDKEFKKGLMRNMGFSKYLCPVCNAHLKDCPNGDLICLNTCHLPKQWQKRFSDKIGECSAVSAKVVK